MCIRDSLYASVLDAKVDIKDAERIEKLPLIFVQTLYLNIKNAVYELRLRIIPV